MKFFAAFFVWIAMFAALSWTLVKAVEGNLWWLLGGLALFFIAFTRYGCKVEH